MSSVASPFWQMAMLVGAGCFLLWETYRGWRAGVIRSGLHLAAMVLSTMIGYFAAQIAAAPFGGFSQIAGLAAGVVVGLVVALIVFILIWIISAVLFKRTEQHKSRVLRFFWGLGGAFFGVLLGLIILWSLISAVRGMGTLAVAQTRAPEGYPSHVERKPSALAQTVIKAKESLELGHVGSFVKTVDPIPESAYTILDDVGRLNSNRAAMQRLIEYPPVQKLFQHPKMIALINDPSIIKGAETGNPMALISNPKLLATVEDSSFLEELQKIDWPAALKFALETPTASPAPSPDQR